MYGRVTGCNDVDLDRTSEEEEGSRQFGERWKVTERGAERERERGWMGVDGGWGVERH